MTCELLLQRKIYNSERARNIIGELFVNGEFFCYTLEDEIRPDGAKLYGVTCIDAGKYKVALTMSNRFKRIMPLLIDVPGFAGIRMHGGNTEAHTLGCLLVGFNVIDNISIQGTAEKKLTEELKKYKESWITIENKPLTSEGILNNQIV